MKLTNWKKLNSKVVYEGYRKIVRKVFVLPNNKKSDYDIIDQGNSVGVLVRNNKNQILLIKQFRPGPEKIMYDLPGGFLEPHLTPLANAKKELMEETGYEAKNFKLLGKYSKDAYSENFSWIFSCDNPRLVEFRDGDENEWIECKFYSQKEIDKIVKSGHAEHTLSLIWVGKNLK